MDASEIKLRPYQEKYIKKIYSSGKRQPLIVLSTGGGKSVIFKKIAHSAIKQDKKVCFIVAGKTILEQAVRKHFSSISNDISFLQGSSKYHLSQVLCCSIDTLSRRKKIHQEIINQYDLFIVDEGHESTSKRYTSFLELIPKKKWVMGFTATPYRIGKKGHTYWSGVVKEITTQQLVDNGFLVKPKIFSAQVMQTKVKKSMGDFNNKELFEKNDTLKIYGDILREYEKHAKKRKAVCFAVNVQHSKNLCEVFNKAGYNSAHIDANTPIEERKNLFESLEKGKINVLFNVNCLSVGFDLPSVDCILLARPTNSLTLFIQQVGRGLRPSKGKKECVVLDFGANTLRLGHPLEDFEAEMQDRDKKLSGSTEKELTISLRACPSCHFILENPNVELCPECGESVKTARQIAQEKEAQLVEIERAFKINEESKKDESLVSFIERYIDIDNIPTESFDESIAPKTFVQNLLKVIRAGNAKKPFLFYKVWEKYGQESLEYINYPQWFKEKVGITSCLDLSLIYD